MTERVENSLFATGDLTGWDTSGSCGGGNCHVSVVDLNPPYGAYYCQMNTSDLDHFSEISQIVQMTGATTLHWEIAINGSWPEPSAIIDIYIGDTLVSHFVYQSGVPIYPWVNVSGFTGWQELRVRVSTVQPECKIFVKPISITGSYLPPKPVAAFTGSPLSGVAPLTVAFTDSSTNTPTEWLWSFGDGYLSNEKNPSHEYADAGSYTVTLKASNDGGFGTLTKVDYVVVSEPPVYGVKRWQLQIGPL